MIDKAELTLLRHRISDGLKGGILRMIDFRCTDCGIGINKGEETFVVSPESIEVWCESCRKDK